MDEKIREAINNHIDYIHLDNLGIGHPVLTNIDKLTQAIEEELSKRMLTEEEIEKILTLWRDKGAIKYTGNVAHALHQAQERKMNGED